MQRFSTIVWHSLGGIIYYVTKSVEKNDCEPCQIEEALSWRDINVLW
jgi:hypothetical protein